MRAPGPSTLQFLYGLRQHGMLELADRLWRKHGGTFEFRIGLRTFMFVAHPDAIERVTLRERHKYDKTKSAEPIREFLTGDGLVGSTGELWRRQRKLLAPLFTPKSIKAYADVMVGDAIRLHERWFRLAREGSEVEIADEMTVVTAAIMLRSMFGSSSIESIDQMRDAVGTMISFVTRRATGMFVPLWIPVTSNRKYLAARALVHRSIAGLIAQRRASDADAWPADLLSLLMKTRDEETGRPMSETQRSHASASTRAVLRARRGRAGSAGRLRRATRDRDLAGSVLVAPAPEFWADPERFDPDRWQRESEENRRAYHPFGAGPRVCIGNHFSMLESHLLLAILARRFTPRLRSGYEAKWDHQGLLSLKHGLPMVISVRGAHTQQ